MRNMSGEKTLLVIVGPTGVGKTEVSLRVAERLGCPIVNADSRQVYREIPIGTAAPTQDEQRRVEHYFVGCKPVEEDYNAGQYERDVLDLLGRLFERHQTVVLSGGSMLYVDAVCMGLDDIPPVDADVREGLRREYAEKGLAWLQSETARLDPGYWAEVDRSNPQRLLHCVEVCRQTGSTLSAFRRKAVRERPFKVVKIGLTRPREELYERINRRVEDMMVQGLEAEARAVYARRACNSLQTVGYRELFAYMDGEYDLTRAVELIQQNSRRYAKRQLTWFRRDKEINWIDLSATTAEQAAEAICNL